MFESFLAYKGGEAGQRLLDVGATPDMERLDSNCMIPWFKDVGLSVSLYSPENIAHLRERFPYARILPSSGFGSPMPAQEKEYDWVSSSAVIEHVGSSEKQVQFIRDCARVGNGLFLTTPNRRHWLEFHTKLPWIHWLPKNIHRRLLARIGKNFWANEDHLNLLDRTELERLAESALQGDFSWSIQTVWALGMPSNLILLAKRLDKRGKPNAVKPFVHEMRT